MKTLKGKFIDTFADLLEEYKGNIIRHSVYTTHETYTLGENIRRGICHIEIEFADISDNNSYKVHPASEFANILELGYQEFIRKRLKQ